MGEIKNFRRRSTPQYSHKSEQRPKNKYRESARKRGYDNDWQKLAKRYRRSVKGLCEECAREGFVHPSDVVDHMIPVIDAPELRLQWSNLDALCHKHHNGIKRRIEQYARKTDALGMLPQWMKYPESRPIHFQTRQRAPGRIVGDGAAFINPIRMGGDEAIGIPKLITPTLVGEEIFSGSGIILHASNNSDTAIIFCDENEDVLELLDGENLHTKLQISDGLTIRSLGPTRGKVSLAYVKNQDKRL